MGNMDAYHGWINAPKNGKGKADENVLALKLSIYFWNYLPTSDSVRPLGEPMNSRRIVSYLRQNWNENLSQSDDMDKYIRHT